MSSIPIRKISTRVIRDERYTKTHIIQCSPTIPPDIPRANISPLDVRVALLSYNPTLLEATSHGRLLSFGTSDYIRRLHGQTLVIVGVLWNVLQGHSGTAVRIADRVGV